MGDQFRELNSDNIHEIKPTVFKYWPEKLLNNVVDNFAYYLTPAQVQSLIITEKLTLSSTIKLLKICELSNAELIRAVDNTKTGEISENSEKDKNSKKYPTEELSENENADEIIESTKQSIKLEIVYIMAGSASLKPLTYTLFTLFIF